LLMLFPSKEIEYAFSYTALHVKNIEKQWLINHHTKPYNRYHHSIGSQFSTSAASLPPLNRAPATQRVGPTTHRGPLRRSQPRAAAPSPSRLEPPPPSPRLHASLWPPPRLHATSPPHCRPLADLHKTPLHTWLSRLRPPPTPLLRLLSHSIWRPWSSTCACWSAILEQLCIN
jgi:hypothetical protein